MVVLCEDEADAGVLLGHCMCDRSTKNQVGGLDTVSRYVMCKTRSRYL